jgi:(E)-2-((N-methylformamido)methylene)succinate hydrolase
MDSGGDDPPVVLIHGVGDNLRSWDDLALTLSPSYRVIRYDMLGSGLTPAFLGTATLADFCKQLIDLLAHLDIDRFALCGFSMGGVVSQYFCRAHASRLDALILMSTVYRRNHTELAGVGERLRLTEEQGPEAIAELAVQRWFPEAFQREHPQIVAGVLERLRNNDARAYANAYRVFVEADAAVGDALKNVHCPALVMTGGADVGSTPAIAQRMVNDLRDGRLIVLEGLRHMMTLEAPQLVSDSVLKFLGAVQKR